MMPTGGLSRAGQDATQRLPGVVFLPRRSETRLTLPRLDVAAFVGFAERGPLHLPVAIEDPNSYRAIFGEDLRLAQVPAPQVAAGAPAAVSWVYANLPRAVEAFFANGGRRCYVVRVAGRRAEAARFRLPGVVALPPGGDGPAPGSGLRLAAVSAASPGAWGARLRLATRLAVTPLPPATFHWSETTGSDAVASSRFSITVGDDRLAMADKLQAGDVLRLGLRDGSHWLGRVAALETRGNRTRLLRMEQLYPYFDALPMSPPAGLDAAYLLTAGSAVPLALSGEITVLEIDGQAVLTLQREHLALVSAGDILRLRLVGSAAGDPGYLTCIRAIRAVKPAETRSGGIADPEPQFEAVLSEFMQLTPAAAAPETGIESVAVLRLDLMVRLDDQRLPIVRGLGFNAPHPAFWGDAVALGTSLLSGRQTAANSARQAGAGSGNIYRESAAWLRRLAEDPAGVLPAGTVDGKGEERPRTDFNPLAALAGLLAPAGSAHGIPIADMDNPAAYALACESVTAEVGLSYLPLGLSEIFDEADPAQFHPPETDRIGSDDLSRYDPAVFYDRRLAPRGAPGAEGTGENHRTLLQAAFELHYIQGRRLLGLHSLLFIDEVALVAAPDASQYGWGPGEVHAEPPPPRPARPEAELKCPPVDPTAPAEFIPIKNPPSLLQIEPYYGPLDSETAVTVRGNNFSSMADMRLFFGLRQAEGLQVLSSTELTARAPTGVRPGPVDVRIETSHGKASWPGGFIYTHAENMRARPQPIMIVLPADSPVDDEPFLAVHQALAIFAQTRADVLAVLSLPRDSDVVRSLEWQAALRRRLGLPRSDITDASEAWAPGEMADLSYAAVYLPWLLVAEPSGARSSAPVIGASQTGGGMRAVPPDGAICGLIAAREWERQVWVAPANVPLKSILGLETAFSDDDWAELFAQRFNLVRAEPKDLRPMSAHTLSRERSLMQISVRRLMILLRKAALQLGMDFVFESNHEVFRQGVRVTTEGFLRNLFARGAFAGRTEAESFRVITDASVNPPQSVEQGRFVAMIQVAPSQPLEYMTVQLIRTGEGGLAAMEA